MNSQELNKIVNDFLSTADTNGRLDYSSPEGRARVEDFLKSNWENVKNVVQHEKESPFTAYDDPVRKFLNVLRDAKFVNPEDFPGLPSDPYETRGFLSRLLLKRAINLGDLNPEGEDSVSGNSVGLQPGLENLVEKDPQLYHEFLKNRIQHANAAPDYADIDREFIDPSRRGIGEIKADHFHQLLKSLDAAAKETGKPLHHDLYERLASLGSDLFNPESRKTFNQLITTHGLVNDPHSYANRTRNFLDIIHKVNRSDVSAKELIEELRPTISDGEVAFAHPVYGDGLNEQHVEHAVETILDKHPDAIKSFVNNVNGLKLLGALASRKKLNSDSRNELNSKLLNGLLSLETSERNELPEYLVANVLRNSGASKNMDLATINRIIKDGTIQGRKPLIRPRKLIQEFQNVPDGMEDYENNYKAFKFPLLEQKLSDPNHYMTHDDIEDLYDFPDDSHAAKLAEKAYHQLKMSPSDSYAERASKLNKNKALLHFIQNEQEGSPVRKHLIEKALETTDPDLMGLVARSVYFGTDEMDVNKDNVDSRLGAIKKLMEHPNTSNTLFNALRPIYRDFMSDYKGVRFPELTSEEGKITMLDSETRDKGYRELKVKPSSSGLRALRTLAEKAGKMLSVKELNAKLNPFRKTVENTRMVDDWNPLVNTQSTGIGSVVGEVLDELGAGGRHLDLNKLQAYKEYASTTPQARSIVPKIDRLIDHVVKTGTTDISQLPPELKSSPIKRKESTSQVMVDWDPITTGGNLDSKKLNQRIEEAPETPLNYFTGQYVAPYQKHNTDRKSQHLLALTVHPKQLEQIKKEGLEELFHKIQQDLSDMHPVAKDSIGWIRWTSAPSFDDTDPSKPHPFKLDHHVDEIQADFDDLAEEMKGGAYGRANRQNIPRLREILFHGLEPSDLLYEAWHQHMRNSGRVGDTYSVWSHKSRKKKDISGLKNLDAPAPVDWQIAYGEKPLRTGAAPSTYGKNKAQNNPTLSGEPTFDGEIHKTERLVKQESPNIVQAFHNADDAAIEQAFHANPNRKTIESTIDELLSSPEGKLSLAAYLQRAANEHHGVSTMKRLIDHSGSYWLKALEDPYRRLAGTEILPHVGKHFVSNIAHEEHVNNADQFIEHLLAHATPDQREEIVRPLMGAPSVKNLALVGTLANTMYQSDPAQLFADLKIDPDLVSKLPPKAQMGYAVRAMETNAQPAHKGKYVNAKVVLENLIRQNGRDFAKKLADYAQFRGVDPQTNELYRDVMESHPALKPFSGTQLSVKTGTAALRKLRDYLKENGDKLPDELPSGQRWNTITKPISGRGGTVQYVLDWNPLRNKAGKLTADSVQAYIDSVQPVTYDFETGEYSDPEPQYPIEQIRNMVDEKTLQRMFKTKHSNNRQEILRLKLSDHDMEKLRATGADQTLATLVDIGQQSGHPVTPKTIGWIRYTKGKDGHVMVDEAQSDLETNFEAALKPQFEKMYPDADPEQLRQALDQFMERLPPAHIQQIREVAFRGKPAAEVLHEALHQYGRHQGWVGSKWQSHSSKSKAPISLDMDKPMPSHFKENYDNLPKALGATPAKYGELETQQAPIHDHLPNSPTWQEEFRKKERK